MADFTSWVGVLVFGFGLYCFYAAFQLKVKGEINATLLLGKDVQYKTCKNKEAYIKDMFPQILIFSIVTTVCGAIDILNSFVLDGKLHIVYLISLVAFVVDFLIFTRAVINAKKKYY